MFGMDQDQYSIQPGDSEPNSSFLLIHPPAVKPCEPPPGLARIQGALLSRGVASRVLDANVEGLLHLIGSGTGTDRWTRRAEENRGRHLNALRNRAVCGRPDRYRRSVADLNRLASAAAAPCGVQLTLSNYRDREKSPLRAGDLLNSAENPGSNPFHPYFSLRLAELLQSENFTHAGFSINYLSQALTAFAMIGFLKKTAPRLKIVIGGGLVTSWMRRSRNLSRSFQGLVDELVAGEGEQRLLAMAGFGPVPDGHFSPRYDSFPWEDYLSPGRIIPYSGSGGCYWRKCAFCPERSEGNPYRPVPAQRILSDLEALIDRVRPSLIHLIDNAISPALMEALIRESVLPAKGARWYGFARITDHLADPEFCRALRRSGCSMLQLGLESGDQGVLDDLEKGIDLGTASKALRNLKEAGIAVYVYLLFGTPSESEEGARRTLDFAVRHHDCIGFINAAIFNLPFQSEISAPLETERFYDGDFTLYEDFTHPKGWDRKSVRLFVEREFKQHPAIRPIILRDPPIFTSNHAPFFAGGGG